MEFHIDPILISKDMKLVFFFFRQPLLNPSVITPCCTYRAQPACRMLVLKNVKNLQYYAHSDTEWTNIANIVALEIVDAVYGNYDPM